VSRELIFVDTETTGFDAQTERLVELSWGRETGPVNTLYFGVKEVPPHIDELIAFTEREISGMTSALQEFTDFFDATRGNTMVSANPPFDRSFLAENNLWLFSYRSLDIESYAMAKLRLDYVPGMKDIYELLTARGHTLAEPRHTSWSDVMALREAYTILRVGY